MKLLSALATNFGSFKSITFDYSNLGLTLISGTTGSGKSTILDLALWTLFGQTSKDLPVDEIRTWGADEPTTATIDVEVAGKTLIVTRIRGKASENDLYYQEDGKVVRGSNLVETQKLINTRLGIDSELYAMASYFSQFSKADNFFSAKAKERRDTFERICDQSFPILLAEKVSAARSEKRKEKEDLQSKLSFEQGALEEILHQVKDTRASIGTWDHSKELRLDKLTNELLALEDKEAKEGSYHLYRLQNLKDQIKDHEKLKCDISNVEEHLGLLEGLKPKYNAQQIKYLRAQDDVQNIEKDIQNLEQLSGECPTCMNTIDTLHKNTHLEHLGVILKEKVFKMDCEKVALDTINISGEQECKSLIRQLKKEQEANNVLIVKYEVLKANKLTSESEGLKARIHALEQDTNPYVSQLPATEQALQDKTDLVGAYEDLIQVLDTDITALDVLYDKSFEVRGILLGQVIDGIQDTTNKFISDYFDGMIKCQFELESSDKLEVEICKDGNPCSFKQLSGGQRSILKLCFNLAIMEASANQAGITFDCLMFDEVLPASLSQELRQKAYSMFEHLSTKAGTVLVIDHSEEFKSLFSNSFKVTLENDESRIEKQ